MFTDRDVNKIQKRGSAKFEFFEEKLNIELFSNLQMRISNSFKSDEIQLMLLKS